MLRVRGFTLLELILVVIILGVLASLGVVQYTNVIEKSRTGEAVSCLGTLRTLELVYYQEQGAYGTAAQLNSGLPTAAPACANAAYYYGYSCDSGTGTCTATRCTGGGKAPQYTAAYTVTLTIGGVLTKGI
jgi:prepilin-type N-terminal cleavage/methylation domain-containing protein